MEFKIPTKEELQEAGFRFERPLTLNETKQLGIVEMYKRKSEEMANLSIAHNNKLLSEITISLAGKKAYINNSGVYTT